MTAYERAMKIAAKLNMPPAKVSDRTYRATVWGSTSGNMVRVYVKDGSKDIGYLELHNDEVGYAYITGAKAALRERVER